MSDSSGGIVLRRMRPSDLDACMELKALAHWNQLRQDWELFLGFHPEGCSVACCGSRVIGTVTTIDYGGRFGWIGMVLVHPEFRRRGVGTELLRAAMRDLARCRAIRLDATPTGKTLYDRLGFRDEAVLHRLDGPRPAAAAMGPIPTTVEPMRETDVEEVVQIDAPVFGACRAGVLRAWYRRTPDACFVQREGNAIQGYAMARPGAHFSTIGPVIAPALEAARGLLTAVAARLPEAPVCVDVPSGNAPFQDWLEGIGLRVQRPFIRMLYGSNPDPGMPERQWAILGPEIG
ncbi:MAG: GNAT family N-acetyltransferase [Lentisphaeria bacterium]|nr:GNAT family N-acetyltransferase [Lentisphaeria bacterium]